MPMIQASEGAYFEYQLIAGFEETNLVGNIYFANYAVWQGKCREMFLYEYCPGILTEMKNGLALITLDLSIQFVSQLFAFDKVIMRMALEAQNDSRLLMRFDYYREDEKEDKLVLVAKGHQAIAAMREKNGKMVPAHLPESLLEVFEHYL